MQAKLGAVKKLFFKTGFLSLLILSGVFFISAAFAQENAVAAGSDIAVVNMQKVISISNQGKKANAEMQALVKKYNAQLLNMRKKIVAIQTDLKQNGSIMSSSEKAKKTKKFETSISKFQAEEKHVQGIMSQKKFELLKGIIDKATVIIKNIAHKNGYLLVIDRPSVVYRTGSIDITNEVLKQMNK